MASNNSTASNGTAIIRSRACPELFRLLTPTETWSQTIALLMIIVFSIAGNVMIISIIKKNRRMRNPTNFFILNLCFANLLIMLVNVPMIAMSRIAPGLGFVGGLAGTILCKLLTFSQACSINAAILTLGVIAADRFFAVFFPLKKVIDSHRARWIIGAVWLAPALPASILLYVNRVFEFRGKNFCVEMWQPLFPKNAITVYTTVDSAVFYALPLLEITVFYIAIIYKVWVRQIPGQMTTANQRLELQAKKKVLKMLIAAVAVFAICWLPYKIVFMFQFYGNLTCFPSKELIFTSFYLAISTCATNPFMYLVFSKDYRDGLKAIFQDLPRCCCKIEPPQHHIRSVDMTEMTPCGSALSVGSFRKVDNN